MKPMDALILLNIILLQVFLVVGVAGAKFGSAQDACSPARCRDSGPEIRFPFWLNDHQPERCGYPRPVFMLSCSPATNTTELNFQYPVTVSTINNTVSVSPFNVKFRVNSIDYKTQKLKGDFITACLPTQFPASADSNVNRFSETFQIMLDGYEESHVQGYTLFNCSSNASSAPINYPYGLNFVVNCFSGGSFQVIAFASDDLLSKFIQPSCTKMYSISDVHFSIFVHTVSSDAYYDTKTLQWFEPSCRGCEVKGKYCIPANATDHAQTPQCRGVHHPSKHVTKHLVKVVVVPLLVLLVLSILLYYILRRKIRKDQEKKTENFLQDYKALKPTRFTYNDIKKITERFKEKLGQGGYGTVYKGKLPNDVLVAVKVLKISKGNGNEFINEVGTIGKIHHVNVVRLVGYCSDGYNRALVYEFLPNDSLEKVIFSRKKINEIGRHKLQEIAIGVAKGLDYLHQGCNQRILHFDIKPQNILLDHHFNPKVADFGLAKLCSKEQSVVFMTAARGTVGYIAPEIFSRNFGSVSYKSDVYSFGMLMLDMVGGQAHFQRAKNQNINNEIYFPEWMYNQLEKGGQIAMQIDEEEDGMIFMRLAIVGLWCIQWYLADRPSMKDVLQMLEGENMPIMPPNPFATTTPPPNTCATTSSSSSEISSQ